MIHAVDTGEGLRRRTEWIEIFTLGARKKGGILWYEGLPLL